MPEQITGDHWRYPDTQKTPIDETSLYLTRQSRGHCAPVLVLDYARRGTRWLDVEIGSSKPPPQGEGLRAR